MNRPMFLKKLSATFLVNQLGRGTYFESIDITIRDILKWEEYSNETSPELWDNEATPQIILSALRVVAVTETMRISGVTALVAGVLLDAKMVEIIESVTAASKLRAKQVKHMRSVLDGKDV
tara:strand:+ start:723 stop:1085 length:363 start_codon:yes stop_codon:yes gene_type:complete